MYKSVSTDIKKARLDTDLYKLHKSGKGKSEFGMDNTSGLLESGFGLYSTTDLNKNIGPVKTEYFRISLTRKGSASFEIGLEKYQPQRNYILFGIPGQIFSLHDISDDFLVYYMLFSEQFISDSFLKLNKKQHFPFLTYSGLQCFELDEDTANEIEAIVFKINDEVKSNKPDCIEAIRLYIQLILIFAGRNYGTILLSQYGTSNTLRSLFNSYLKLVSQHFLSTRKVADYAKKLHVSPDHLNRAIKYCSDKTAHELIDEMILMEAKAYLLHSNITVSEIAYKLEFADPSHFNRFFKKNCGQTPLEFRRKS
jgi:AraC family transcriptional regulator, transcriptional activator of pobA